MRTFPSSFRTYSFPFGSKVPVTSSTISTHRSVVAFNSSECNGEQWACNPGPLRKCFTLLVIKDLSKAGWQIEKLRVALVVVWLELSLSFIFFGNKSWRNLIMCASSTFWPCCTIKSEKKNDMNYLYPYRIIRLRITQLMTQIRVRSKFTVSWAQKDFLHKKQPTSNRWLFQINIYCCNGGEKANKAICLS